MRETFLFIVRVTVVCAATAFGALLGWQGHGWDGTLGFGVVGFGAGSAFVAFPGFWLDLLGSLCLDLLRFLWEVV